VSIKIFLSTVSDEFRAYRDQLRSDLTRDNVEVKVQEDFKDYGGDTLDKLDIYISACDAVVHLVGDMTGAAAKPASTQAILAKYPDIPERLPPLRKALEYGVDISYTQWEAWLALYHGKALLIAQSDKAAPRGPEFAPTWASQGSQQAHLERLRAIERYPGITFGSPDQLAKQIAYTTILDLLAKERSGAPSRVARGFPYAGLIGVLFVLLLTPLVADQWAKTLGVSPAAPLALLLAVSGVALALLHSRYFGMLSAGAEGAGSLERQGYDTLRQNLATGGHAVRVYSRWLTVFLNAVDGFFGDAGMADRTLFPRAFGLRTPAPLWTAPAFDRCLLLALLYPIVTVYIMWTVSGHVGPAEEALGLPGALSSWKRGIAVTALGLSAFGFWRSARMSGRISFVWSIVGGAVAVVAGIFAVPGSGPFAVAVASVGAFAVAVAVIGAVADASDVYGRVYGRFAVAGPFAVGVAVIPVVVVRAFDAFTSTVTASVIMITVSQLNATAIRNRWHGIFLLLFFVGTTSGCLMAAHLLSSSPDWHSSGPLLLFLGLLTLLNAPFDWASLGLTRALLRLGLELKSWWPFLLALVDGLFAAVIVALLALTMVIGVQTFDALAVHGGGKPVLPLDILFKGIAAHPEAPEFWWVYALLLSTMIPSLINLMIGGTALMRAVPGLSQWLLNYLPATGAVRTYDRAWIAAVLTGQVALGVILGVGMQALLAYGLIFYAMPAVGLGLLDVTRGLADLELPTRLIRFLAGEP
jgi:hypothetical protein